MSRPKQTFRLSLAYNSSYTDLALEVREQLVYGGQREIPGVAFREKRMGRLTISEVDIFSPEGAKAMGKPMGRYITIEAPGLKNRDRALVQEVSQQLTDQLVTLMNIPPTASVLVVGLGNWKATPDSLGPKVINRLLVTRHLHDYVPRELAGRLRAVSAMAPGVLGTTGMETKDIIEGICAKLNPDLVIAVDALAARSVDRIITTVQLSNAGIHPGSGVGNRRAGLNILTLGRPVIALGVPTVVSAITIALDSIDALTDYLQRQGHNYGFLEALSDQQKRQLIYEVLDPMGANLMVTPKEIDMYIEELAVILSGALNAALHPGISEEQISQYIM
ncbi:MAG TPA: GPR endopeptidase [Firmicutes bacterium]|nr:GPR endopeptidase [Bacillota bacterium]